MTKEEQEELSKNRALVSGAVMRGYRPAIDQGQIDYMNQQGQDRPARDPQGESYRTFLEQSNKPEPKEPSFLTQSYSPEVAGNMAKEKLGQAWDWTKEKAGQAKDAIKDHFNMTPQEFAHLQYQLKVLGLPYDENYLKTLAGGAWDQERNEQTRQFNEKQSFDQENDRINKLLQAQSNLDTRRSGYENRITQLSQALSTPGLDNEQRQMLKAEQAEINNQIGQIDQDMNQIAGALRANQSVDPSLIRNPRGQRQFQQPARQPQDMQKFNQAFQKLKPSIEKYPNRVWNKTDPEMQEFGEDAEYASNQANAIAKEILARQGSAIDNQKQLLEFKTKMNRYQRDYDSAAAALQYEPRQKAAWLKQNSANVPSGFSGVLQIADAVLNGAVSNSIALRDLSQMNQAIVEIGNEAQRNYNATLETYKQLGGK